MPADPLGLQMAVAKDHALTQQVPNDIDDAAVGHDAPDGPAALVRLTTWQLLQPASSALGMCPTIETGSKEDPGVRPGWYTIILEVVMHPYETNGQHLARYLLDHHLDGRGNDGAASGAPYSRRIGAVTGSRRFRRW